MIAAAIIFGLLGLVAGQNRLVYYCGFENDLCGLSGNENAWLRYNQKTPSFNTGPALAYAGSYFVYFESSDPNYQSSLNLPLSLTLPANISTSAVRLQFALYAYGSSIKSFNVLIYDNSGVLLTNDQILNSQIQMDSFSPWTIINKTYTFSSIVRTVEFIVNAEKWLADVAIDDLSIYAIGCGTCSINGLCQNTTNGQQCVCRNGYVGDGYTCLPNCLSPCDPIKATCVVSMGVASCQCLPQYGSGSGLASAGNSSCSINMCGSTQCSPYADCVMDSGVPVCKCRPGFVCGANCVTQGLCSNRATCSVVNGLETCICGMEYFGDGLNAPGSTGCKSKCDLLNCGLYGRCVLNSSYAATCQCNDNFMNNGTYCVDINECLTPGWCRGANTYCSNSFGGFSCECMNNFAPDMQTSGRNRSCSINQQCALGKTCDCNNIISPITVPPISFFNNVNDANQNIARQFLDIWSSQNVKLYCKMAKCNLKMLEELIANITAYTSQTNVMMNNANMAIMVVRDFINCNPYEMLDPAWWSLYKKLNDQLITFKQVSIDLDMKVILLKQESARCEEVNSNWFRRALEWFSPVQY
ncbi:uncharacterized protein LOC100209198 isoform X1 [Hydra vulgaris]|uniref:uncharacterized protein LOC100209198 isoform X1 n=1 Tax=Hydra vulgaris TaxID=6087 RepID=UPI0002B4B429|nr:uncharacterized protein LOC100209198 isoform X1 [Hydra vulgaris]